MVRFVFLRKNLVLQVMRKHHNKFQPSRSKHLEIILFKFGDRRHQPLKNYSSTDFSIPSWTKIKRDLAYSCKYAKLNKINSWNATISKFDCYFCQGMRNGRSCLAEQGMAVLNVEREGESTLTSTIVLPPQPPPGLLHRLLREGNIHRLFGKQFFRRWLLETVNGPHMVKETGME